MLCMLGSLHANRDKIIKYIKLLCWSNNVETGNAVFKTIRSVFLLLAGDVFHQIFKIHYDTTLIDIRWAHIIVYLHF